MEVVDVLNSNDGVSSKWLLGRWQLSADLWVSTAGGFAWVTSFFFFFFFGGLWVVGSVIRDGHKWWSSAWEALLASLLA